MASVVVVSKNPLNNPFVRQLMGEISTRDERYRAALAGRSISEATYVMEFSFIGLNLLAMVLASIIFSIALSGYGWFASLKGMMGDGPNHEIAHTIFHAKEFNLEHASQLLFGVCGLIFCGILMSTVGIYESSRIKLLWSFLFLLIAIPVELIVLCAGPNISGRNCDHGRLKTRLEELLQIYHNKNNPMSDVAIRALRKLNSLQSRLNCCGVKSYMDYMGHATSGEFGLPISCCVPSWAQNLYCTFDVSKSADAKLKENRLHQEGCLQKVTELCEMIYFAFTRVLLILFIIHLVVIILQVFVAYLKIRSFKKQIKVGLFKNNKVKPPTKVEEDEGSVLTLTSSSEGRDQKSETDIKQALSKFAAKPMFLKILERAKQKGLLSAEAKEAKNKEGADKEKTDEVNSEKEDENKDKIQRMETFPMIATPKIIVHRPLEMPPPPPPLVPPPDEDKPTESEPQPEVEEQIKVIPLRKRRKKKTKIKVEPEPTPEPEPEPEPAPAPVPLPVVQRKQRIVVKKKPEVVVISESEQQLPQVQEEPHKKVFRKKKKKRKPKTITPETPEPAWVGEPSLGQVHEEDVADEYVGGTEGQRKLSVIKSRKQFSSKDKGRKKRPPRDSTSPEKINTERDKAAKKTKKGRPKFGRVPWQPYW